MNNRCTASIKVHIPGVYVVAVRSSLQIRERKHRWQKGSISWLAEGREIDNRNALVGCVNPVGYLNKCKSTRLELRVRRNEAGIQQLPGIVQMRGNLLASIDRVSTSEWHRQNCLPKPGVKMATGVPTASGSRADKEPAPYTAGTAGTATSNPGDPEAEAGKCSGWKSAAATAA